MFSLVLVILASFGVAGSVTVQPNVSCGQEDRCKDVLANNSKVFNFSSSRSYKENLITWLRSTSWEEISKDISQKISLGIPIDGIPVQIGYGSDESDRKRFQKALDTGLINNIAEETAIAIYSSVPDDEGIKAWKECMDKHASAAGLTWESHITGSDLYLDVHWRPTVGGGPLRGFRIGGTNAKLVSAPSKKIIEVDGSASFQFRIINRANDATGFVATVAGRAHGDYTPPQLGNKQKPKQSIVVNVSVNKIEFRTPPPSEAVAIHFRQPPTASAHR